MDSSNPLNPETTDTPIYVRDIADTTPDIDDASDARLASVYEREHSAVLGARLGACLFSSFVFPATLWGLGAATPALACGIAALLSLLTARPMLLLGGQRVGRVVLLEIAIAAALLPRVLGPLAVVPAAIFLPIVGLLVVASISARLTERVFAEHDERPHEVEAAVARATESNVVDIRSADAARRGAGKKARNQSTAGAVTHSLQSQI